MLEHFVELFLEILIPICELMGISVVAISAGTAFSQYVKSLIKRVPCNVKFQLANGLALSLEFKMAAEILKTVLIRDFGATFTPVRESPVLSPDDRAQIGNILEKYRTCDSIESDLYAPTGRIIGVIAKYF